MFEKIFGNDEVKKILYNDITANSIVSSYIFEGKDTDYVESLAMEFAGLLLKSKDPEKKADFASFGKSEKINKDNAQFVAKDVYIRPFELDRKVYLLHNSEDIQVESQNVLLKTLEEAPKYVVVIFITKSLNMILDTIISRSKIIRVKPLSRDEVIAYIEKNHPNLDDKALYASISMGSLGRLDKLLKDDEELSLRKKSLDMLIDILDKKRYESIKQLDFLEEHKDDIEKILSYFESFIKDMASPDERVVNIDYKSKLKKYRSIALYSLTKSIDMIEETKRYLSNSGNFRLHLETLILNIIDLIGD